MLGPQLAPFPPPLTCVFQKLYLGGCSNPCGCSQEDGGQPPLPATMLGLWFHLRRAMLPVFLIPSPTLSICRSCNPDGNNREDSLPSPPTGGISIAGATDQASWLSKHPNSSLLIEQMFYSGRDTLSLPGPANLLPPVPPGRAKASL